MSELQPIDVVALAIVGIATLRGLFLGFIREIFSLGAVAAAVIAVRVWNDPVAEWLVRVSDGSVSEAMSPWAAGTLLAVGVLAAVGAFGKVMGRGARAVGFGLFDRMGGAALGVAEGAVAMGALLLIIANVLGRDHTLLASSRSLELLEQVQRVAEQRSIAPPDVAAPAARR